MLLNLTMQPLCCGIVGMILDKALRELGGAEEEFDFGTCLLLFLTYINFLSFTLGGKSSLLILLKKLYMLLA